MSTKTINTEKFLELVQMLDSQKHLMPGMESVVGMFNELGGLMEDMQKAEDEESKAKIWEAANACNVKLQNEFSNLCKSWGFSVEELQAVIEDPKNYSVEEWSAMQDVKRQAEAVMNEEARRPTKKRKARGWA